MFWTWRVNRQGEGEEGQEEVEVDLVEEMEENKSKRLAGVLSSAQTRSLEQLCQLVKSGSFAIKYKLHYGHSFRGNILIHLNLVKSPGTFRSF